MVRWDEATVDERKILDYLLSTGHPIGRDKAIFFMGLGYRRGAWRQLRDDLLNLAANSEVVAEQESEFGKKYVVEGVLRSPLGRMVGVRTVWISDDSDDPPRLVTAYPS